MDDIEKQLLALEPEEQTPDEQDELSIFKNAFRNKKEKKRKKNKLFSEIDDALENDDEDLDQMMVDVLHFKPSKKKNRADGELFDVKDKDGKKIKSIEAKFKPELANLQKLLRDNENTIKMIKTVLEPLLTSKARGSSKLLADLIMTMNSANGNRLSTIKEISSVKKSIYDLKIKMEKDSKDEVDGMPMDQFGSRFFDELFRKGRNNVIEAANQSMPEYNVDQTSTLSVDDIVDSHLSEGGEYRSDEANKLISYEYLKPEIYIQKSFNTGDLSVVAIGSNGVQIDDYPVPTLEDLGKLTFNNETHTCTDITGRTFKVIEVD